jgi:hypothetical protein
MVRWTPQELATVQRRAEEAGVSVADYLRGVALG